MRRMRAGGPRRPRRPVDWIVSSWPNRSQWSLTWPMNAAALLALITPADLEAKDDKLTVLRIRGSISIGKFLDPLGVEATRFPTVHWGIMVQESDNADAVLLQDPMDDIDADGKWLWLDQVVDYSGVRLLENVAAPVGTNNFVQSMKWPVDVKAKRKMGSRDQLILWVHVQGADILGVPLTADGSTCLLSASIRTLVKTN